MSGEPELTGLAKHFNSTTFTGRANVAKVRLLLARDYSGHDDDVSGHLRRHSPDRGGGEGQELHEEMKIFLC